MFEKQIKKLAKILVNHSVCVKPGELVRIRFYGPGKPLVDELCKQISKKGAWPWVGLNTHTHEKYAPIKLLKKEFPLGKDIAHKIDSSISIDDRNDLYALKNVDNTRINTAARANTKNKWHIINNKKWVIVRYPTYAFAQRAGMSYEEYAKYAFKTMNVNWKKMKKKMVNLKNKLDKTDKIRIIGKQTDLSFIVKDRISTICWGKYNMPDGEVFTAPVKESANGTLFVPIAYYHSKKFENIKLEFKKGRVVKYSVKNDKKEFGKIISADKGSKNLGELGIGKNNAIKNIIGDILFDEKIGGTIHLALGAAYKENHKKEDKKNANKSAVHWDMIIRPEKLLFDTKSVKL